MILAFTGAGISRDSGISTFMEQPEVRDRLYRSYAKSNPDSYNKTIYQLLQVINIAQPNDAHHALNEYNVPIITMNIDGLHEKAGSKVLALHGTMPNENEVSIAHTLEGKPVLYGDAAPNYQHAMDKVGLLQEGDIFLVIGASHHTAIAVELREFAKFRKAEIIEIQANAKHEVRTVLERLKAEGKL